MTPFENDGKALQFIEEMTQNANAVQKDVLTQILTQNAETEYLKNFNLKRATDRETFKAKIPVVSYEDIQPLIQRIANGDFSPILTAQPVTEFLTSTGTSRGEKKLIPLIKQEIDRRNLLQSLFMPVVNQYVKGLDKGKGLCFYSVHPETKTPGGLLARFSHTSYFKSDYFKNQIDYLSNIYTSPVEAILCEDPFQSTYTQMLCGLYQREQVFWVGALFASCFLQSIKFLQCNWKQLAHDIRTGSLDPKVADPSIRECMGLIVRPDPDLADFITRECEEGNWEGIITRIWPNTKYLDVVITGTMAQYILILNHYSGGLRMSSIVYSSSECYFGLNLNPTCDPYQVNYTLMPNMAYFEFLPLDPVDSVEPHKASLKPVDLVDVEIGKEYEVLVTTYAGLYRYRVGDILRVSRFYNSAPQFQFMGRKDVILSVHVDKTYECEIQEAIARASQLLNNSSTSVVEYTSCVDITMFPGHYVIYWELLNKDPSDSPSHEVFDQCCLAMEESLNSMYRQCRVMEESIGPLEIRIVKNGTFEELMEYAISRGASIDQYKVPRCVSAMPIIKLLNSRVISTHLSPSLPHWEPGPCG